jgi:hypothetical protein
MITKRIEAEVLREWLDARQFAQIVVFNEAGEFPTGAPTDLEAGATGVPCGSCSPR